MWLFQKNLESITEGDIDTLIADETVESRQLEFKEIVPVSAQNDEFRADVSAMANGSGGLMLFGASSKSGKVVGKPGMESSDVDRQLRHIEQVIRSGIEPKLVGYRPRELRLANGKSIILLKILRSFNMPHRVVKTGRFAIRNGPRKDDMSIEEIRAAFLFSSSYLERINAWIDGRVEKALETSPLQSAQSVTPKRLLIFVVPVSSFDDESLLDVEAVAKLQQYFQPIGSGSSPGRYVAEGFLTHRGTFGTTGQLLDYAKVYRSGRIEVVDEIDGTEFGERELEEPIIRALRGYLSGLKALDVTPPIFIKVVLTGLSGSTFLLSSKYWQFKSEIKQILENELSLPAIWVREWSDSDNIGVLLKPAFDALWNSAGFAGSPNYKNGEYVNT